jgi:hypothetical protein
LKIFLILWAAHLMGDVAFASHRLAILKRTSAFLSQFKGQASHCIIHSFLAGLLLFIGNFDWMKGAILVFCAHLFIDLVRSNVEIKLYGQGKVQVKRSEFVEWVSGKSGNPEKMNLKNLRIWLLINAVDQGSHIISLYLISMLIR